ncbi:MAG: hypothetical protein U0414_23435 [Polyangiaceae bacterium]
MPASTSTMGGGSTTDFVGGVLGRYPDSLLLGVTTTSGHGSAVMLRYDAAKGWSVIPSKPALGFVVDPAFSLGLGALFADVNFVGDTATSPTGLLVPGPGGYGTDPFKVAKAVRLCFDHEGGGVFLSRTKRGAPLTVWTLTDDSETARGVLRRDGVTVAAKPDGGGTLREPLFVRTSGQIVAGFVPPPDPLTGPGNSPLIATCDAGVCHPLEPLPERPAELRELGGSIVALVGNGIIPGMYGSGDVVVLEAGAWRRVAMSASYPRVSHFLTLDDGSGTLLVLAEGPDGTRAIVRLDAR